MQDMREIQRVISGTPGLSLASSRGGAILEVATPSALARIALQGAQVLSWTPRGHDDVLWCSSSAPLGGGKPIRGGIPICWPWFGPHATDARRPQHGYARNVAWHLVDASQVDDGRCVVLTFSLPHDLAERAHGPAGLSVQLFLEVGANLGMRLETENEGDATVTLSSAFHTYVRVGHAAEIRIEGLEGRRFRDNTANGAVRSQAGPVRIAAETVALYDEGAPRVLLLDPLMKRRVVVSAGDATPSTIIWHPGATAASTADIPRGEESRFVCVESGAIGARSAQLAPGDLQEFAVSYHVEPL
jgi:glucose-6-phosphate 1-epimerase